MKILFVYFDANLEGGASFALQFLLGELKRKGVQECCVMPNNGELRDWMNDENIENHHLWKYAEFIYPAHSSLKDFCFYPYRFLITLLTTFVNTLRVCSLVIKFSPDFIYSNCGVVACGFFASKLMRIRHIWHLREYFDLDFKMCFIPSMSCYRAFLKKSYTIAITPMVAEHLGCLNNIRNKVIYDGVMYSNQSTFSPIKKKYFLFVGHIQEVKGCTLLIKAFVNFAKTESGVDLLFAGNGNPEYVEFLKKIAASEGVLQRISFLGFRSDRYTLMKNAIAVVVPSFNEAFGFITVEAIMNGSLVLGYDSGGTKLIMDKIPDVSFPFASESQLSKLMSFVINIKEDDYRKRVFKSQLIAKSLFSIESNGEKIYSFLNSLG